MPNTQVLVVEGEEICIGFIEHTLAEKGCKIAVAKVISFDALTYLGNGNIAEVTINTSWKNIAC
ncbi:hypothetical protein [Methylomonas sp. AM2-LC]|uniref:hypothetical protein n=1 Tax=Methylomonas sp. AM2-LC TaxID=3153301 RepID=UPI0032654135